MAWHLEVITTLLVAQQKGSSKKVGYAENSAWVVQMTSPSPRCS